MLYAVLCYADEAAVTAWTKDEEAKIMGALLKVQEKVKAEGRLGPVARLMPTTTATTLRKRAGEPLVIDGPFAETKEQFLGFYMVDCADLDEALDFARQLQAVNPGSTAYEIRPIGLYRPGTLETA